MERKIVIGLITSTEYLNEIRTIWDAKLLESAVAKILSDWAITYYDKYGKAAGKNFEQIFYKKAKEGLDKDTAEEIEEDILPDLNEEFIENGTDLKFLIEETKTYLNAQRLQHLKEEIEAGLDEKRRGTVEDKIKQTQEIIQSYRPIETEKDSSLDFNNPESIEKIQAAFQESAEPIIKWPKQLGEFWNDQFVPGAFLSFLAIEKRGKTWLLLEIAMRALRQGRPVAFFQAGDMSEFKQIIRIAIHLTGVSNEEKYCGEHYQTVRDCILNQMDDCDNPLRECDFGLFDDMDKKELKKLDKKELIEAYEAAPDYKACYNCANYDKYKLGVPWIEKIKAVTPIDGTDAVEAVNKFFVKYKRQFKLSTHANGTLSFAKINRILDVWQKEGFVPEVILCDYMDIMEANSLSKELRHQENQKWKDARKLSQTPRNGILPLFVSPTQADGPAYKSYRLKLENYSEDKRKYGHVTAMWGLNQDPGGREKQLGIMRINELVKREGDFSNDNEVVILQNLRKGKPLTGSYFS